MKRLAIESLIAAALVALICAGGSIVDLVFDAVGL